MASLANQSISSTYDGLIKTSSDQPVPASGVQLLEDGVGNTLALSVGRANNGVTITGTVNAANLSVTGTILDSDGDAGTSGQVLSSTGTGTNWIDAGGGGTIDGSGTANYITKWLDTDTITDSVIYESSGNIGIGTSSPVASLTSINTGSLTLDSNDGDHSGFGLFVAASSLSANTVNTAIGFGRSDGRKLAAIGMQTYGDTDQAGLNFYVQETASGSSASLGEAMRIDASGNVGIGTSSPNTRLDVNGVINVRTNGYEFGRIKTNNADADSGGLTFQYNNNTVFTDGLVLNHQGNVGIGTSSPSSALDVQGSGTGDTNILTLTNFEGDDTGDETANIRFRLTRSYTDPDTVTDAAFIKVGKETAWTSTSARNAFMSFYTRDGASDPSERMRIDSSGKVGIGTTSPANTLHVVSSSGYHTLDSVGGVSLIDFRTTGNTTQGGVAIGADAVNTLSFRTASTERMTIDASGNIGAPSGSNIYNASDARLKQNVVSIENGLDTISNLNPVKFNWIEGFSESEQGKDMLGFVAQEVQQVLPEAVEDFGNNILEIGDTTIENPLRVNEKFIIPVLVKAIQELKAEIETLKSQING